MPPAPWTTLAAAGLAAAAISRLACAPAAALARRWGMLSAPSAQRAGTGRVPLLGGLAVVAGLIGGLAAATALGAPAAAAWLPPVALLAAYGLIGGLDDRRGLDPATRLLLEIFAATLALRLGCLLGGDACALRGLSLLAGALAITAAANAVNLTDNADGLASGAGALTLAGLALWPAPGGAGAVWPSAAGALLGLWLVNRPPARIYLGDLGALAVGGVIGYGVWQRWLVAPPGPAGAGEAGGLILLLGYTVFDPTYAVLRRLRARRAPWVGGVDHPSHDLAALLPGRGRALAVLLAAHAVSVAAGLALARGRAPAAAVAAGLAAWTVVLTLARIGARRRKPNGSPGGCRERGGA
jgi:UDP-GlcNAc:undecaprenyl-phosphate GlcNAc-1-phosphate transferase